MRPTSDDEILKWDTLARKEARIHMRRMNLPEADFDIWYNTALIGVWKALASYNQTASLAAYITIVVRRHVKKEWLKLTSRGRDTMASYSPVEQAVFSDLSVLNADFVQRANLTDDELDVLLRMTMYKEDRNQIAAGRGCSVSWVKHLVASARKKIMEEIRKGV